METNIKNILGAIHPVLEVLTDAVRIFDASGGLVYENNACRQMSRRSSREMVSDSADIIIDGETLGKVTVYHDMSEINRLRNDLDSLRQGLRHVEMRYTFDDLIGTSTAFASSVLAAKNAATTPASILIEGESGTGKAVFAQAIHNASRRRTQNFVRFDCAADCEVFYNELLGFPNGSGLPMRSKGLVEEANRGTLYLANIDLLSPEMQQVLLTVMVERKICPRGSYSPKEIDVRFLASSKRSLTELVLDGGFSRELCERLSVFTISIPPLRERKDDIGAIVKYFINQYNFILNLNISGVEPAAETFLKEQSWPGNVRELENLLSKTIVAIGDGEDEIRKIHILNLLENTQKGFAASQTDMVVKLSEAVGETERAHITNAIWRNSGDKNKAAADLDIPLRTLYYKCKKLGIV